MITLNKYTKIRKIVIAFIWAYILLSVIVYIHNNYYYSLLSTCGSPINEWQINRNCIELVSCASFLGTARNEYRLYKKYLFFEIRMEGHLWKSDSCTINYLKTNEDFVVFDICNQKIKISPTPTSPRPEPYLAHVDSIIFYNSMFDEARTLDSIQIANFNRLWNSAKPRRLSKYSFYGYPTPYSITIYVGKEIFKVEGQSNLVIDKKNWVFEMPIEDYNKINVLKKIWDDNTKITRKIK